MKHEELALERQCREFAREHGWVACKLEKNAHKGIPDDLFISPRGECVLVEFKASATAKKRIEQLHWQKRYPNLVFFCSDFLFFCEILGHFGGEKCEELKSAKS